LAKSALHAFTEFNDIPLHGRIHRELRMPEAMISERFKMLDSFESKTATQNFSRFSDFARKKKLVIAKP